VAQNDTPMPSYIVHFRYLPMLAGLVARDILILRCLLLGAQIILALCLSSQPPRRPVQSPVVRTHGGLDFGVLNCESGQFALI
jgi:hypothetical protein